MPCFATLTCPFSDFFKSGVTIMRKRAASVFFVLGLGVSVSAAASTISGSPDPVQVCDGSGLAQITLSWNAADINPPPRVEVRVGSPGGSLFAAGMATGSAVTGKWVANGTTFILVNGANKQPLTQYVARLTTAGCPAPAPKTFWQRLFGK